LSVDKRSKSNAEDCLQLLAGLATTDMGNGSWKESSSGIKGISSARRQTLHISNPRFRGRHLNSVNGLILLLATRRHKLGLSRLLNHATRDTNFLKQWNELIYPVLCGFCLPDRQAGVPTIFIGINGGRHSLGRGVFRSKR